MPIKQRQAKHLKKNGSVIKPRNIYMDDPSYASCVAVAGAFSFSAWAVDVLLREVKRAAAAPKMRGTVCGGSCQNSECEKTGAVWKNINNNRYYCEDHATALNNHTSGMCTRETPKLSVV